MSKRYYLDDQVRDDLRLHLSTQVLDLKRDRIVSFAGTSQFTAQGVSACGLAAFNFARVAFRTEQNRRTLADVLDELSTREIIEEIVAICAGWSSNVHLEVDDIHALPVFSRCLKLTSIEYGSPHPDHFQDLLERMKETEESSVMIITRPPEIIACLKFAKPNTDSHSSTLNDPVFVVFDSHPRPSHPQGAGLSFSTSIENTARTLSDILPTMDENLFDSTDFQWQAQLLSNCSAHVFVARHRRKDHEQAIVRCSLAILDLRARISELSTENRKLESDKKELESEASRLRASIRQEQAKAKQDMFTPLTNLASRALGRSFGIINHAVAGPSGTSNSYARSIDTPSAIPVKRNPLAPPSTPSATGARSIFADNPPPVPSQMPSRHAELDFEDGSDVDDPWIQSTRLALQLQNEFDYEERQLRREHARLVRQVRKDLDAEDRQLHQDHARLARQLQNEFDIEDQRLRREQKELARHIQATFQCSICIDELSEDYVAKIDGCTHTMCRTCLREFVSSKIQEHRYPIFCPVCTAETGKKAEPSAISRALVEQLGVNEEQSQILTEMELAEFTIQIHCRKCQRPAFVDREDYKDVHSIVCPQNDCHHVWCKKCEQAIVVDGPKHSCDGSSELEHLMKEKGWKHCPNCTTPILKETGCHHMMCISPGCNTHFCYVCGGMIVRSALNHEIGTAVSEHYRKCQLFDVPN